MSRILLALVLCLAGCASAPPERAYYLLRAELPGPLAAPDPGSLAGVGRVSVAPYLDRAGIVVQTGEHRVREARYHLWAEPLEQGIRVYLRDRVSSVLGRALNTAPGRADSWRYRIDVSIEEFHGKLDGDVRLVARWSLVDLADDAVLETQRFSRMSSQASDGYPGLLETLTSLLDELAESIAEALRRT